MRRMIFWNLLQISATVSVVGAVLLALRGLLKRRYPARAMSLVWCALALRLLVPVQLTLPKPAVILTPPPMQTVVAAPQDVRIQTDEATGETAAAQTIPAPAPRMHIADALMAMWFAGACALLLGHMGAYAWFCMQMRRSSRPAQHAALQRMFADTRSALGIRRNIALRITPAADCPMLVGIVHPVLLLPEESVPPQDAELIFRHELLHWKHGDLAAKWVLAFAADVHWMNPCVRLLARAGAADLELACDSAVVRGMDFAQRRHYGQVILQAASTSGRARRQEALLSRFAGNQKGLRERMQNLFDETIKKRGVALLFVVMVTLAIVGGNFAIRQEAAAADPSVTAQLTQLAQIWGAGVQARSAKPNYDMMTAQNAAAFYAQQQNRLAEMDPDGTFPAEQRERALWNVGVSSPSVNGFAVAAVDAQKLQATLVYNWHLTGMADMRTVERLTFVYEDGSLKVAEYGNDSMPGAGALSNAVDSLAQFELLYANDLGLPQSSYPDIDMDEATAAQHQLGLVGGKMTAQRDYLAPGHGDSAVQGKVLTYTFADESVVNITMLSYLPMDWTREDGTNSRTPIDLARQWARGGQHKSGQYRYPIMQAALQEQFAENQTRIVGGDGWFWKIVGSSPSIKRWTMLPEAEDGSIRLVYASWDSTPHEYRGEETLQFGKDARGRTVVTATTDETLFGSLISEVNSVTQFTQLYDNALGLPEYDEELLEVLGQKANLSTPGDALLEFFYAAETPGSITAQTEGETATATAVLPEGGALRFTLENRGSEAKPLWYPVAWSIVQQ